MKLSLITFLITLFASLSLSAQVEDSLKFQSLPPKEFKEKYLQEKNPLLIDVREYSEYRLTRIKNSVNMPFKSGYDLVADTIRKERPLFLYCYSGVRSRKAAIIFFDKGFHNLYSLKGGIMRWKIEGMKVVKRKLKEKVVA